jgi:chromosome segregation ATPase
MDTDPFLFGMGFSTENNQTNKINELEKKIDEMNQIQEKIIAKFNKFVVSHNLLADYCENMKIQIEVLNNEIQNLKDNKNHKKRKISN